MLESLQFLEILKDKVGQIGLRSQEKIHQIGQDFGYKNRPTGNR
jgi:hypothetical protein